MSISAVEHDLYQVVDLWGETVQGPIDHRFILAVQTGFGAFLPIIHHGVCEFTRSIQIWTATVRASKSSHFMKPSKKTNDGFNFQSQFNSKMGTVRFRAR